jgi:hypothetical protein
MIKCIPTAKGKKRLEVHRGTVVVAWAGITRTLEGWEIDWIQTLIKQRRRGYARQLLAEIVRLTGSPGIVTAILEGSEGFWEQMEKEFLVRLDTETVSS